MWYEAAFLDWLREKSTKTRRFGSICTGALVPAEADLLDGRRATTHWNWCSELAQSYPCVKVDPDPIYVRDGNCYTSAGVSAGIDLALALVEEHFGGSSFLDLMRFAGFSRFGVSSGISSIHPCSQPRLPWQVHG